MPLIGRNAGARHGLRVKTRALHVNPQDIRFVQYPEFFWQRGHSKKRISVLDGDWDRVIDGRLFWSGKYEKIEGVDAGMLPIENFVFFASAKAHFCDSQAWEETEWVQWVRRTRMRRYRSDEDIAARLQFLDTLYEDCLAGRYQNREDDLPLINVGREDRLSLEDGRHRLCVAIIAGLRDIRVTVATIHPSSVSSRYGSKVLNEARSGGWARFFSP
ncbi:MAG: hypothetical protein AAGH70_07140, partial [Pseudomonadota bacterium]